MDLLPSTLGVILLAVSPPGSCDVHRGRSHKLNDAHLMAVRAAKQSFRERTKTMDKWFAKSLTMWGLVIAVLPGLSQLTGFEISASEIADLEGQGKSLVDALQAIVGLVMGVIGRKRATGTITLLPRLPS